MADQPFTLKTSTRCPCCCECDPATLPASVAVAVDALDGTGCPGATGCSPSVDSITLNQIPGECQYLMTATTLCIGGVTDSWSATLIWSAAACRWTLDIYGQGVNEWTGVKGGSDPTGDYDYASGCVTGGPTTVE